MKKGLTADSEVYNSPHFRRSRNGKLLEFNELRSFRQRLLQFIEAEGVEGAVLTSRSKAEKKVLTAACNAVEFASR
jgi:hypothetical protein